MSCLGLPMSLFPAIIPTNVLFRNVYICYVVKLLGISLSYYQNCRAVANGPVGPAMAGPIIAVVIFFLIKKINIFFSAGPIIEAVFSAFFFKYKVAINDF